MEHSSSFGIGSVTMRAADAESKACTEGEGCVMFGIGHRSLYVAAIATSLAVAAAAVYVLMWPGSIRVEIWNRCPMPLHKVTVRCDGVEKAVPLIPSGAAGRVRVRPLGEAHSVQVAFSPASGPRQAYEIEIYLESNYFGRLTIYVTGRRPSVSCTASIRMGWPLGALDRWRPPVTALH